MDQPLSNSPAGTDPNILSRLSPLSNHGQRRTDAPINGSAEPANKVTRACNVCRKKKIKCDGETPSCGPCAKYNIACVFTPSRRRLKKTSIKMRTERFETRLVQMEELLKMSGLPPELCASPSSSIGVGSSHSKDFLDQKERELSGPTALDDNFHQNFSVTTHSKTESPMVSDDPMIAQWSTEEKLTTEHQEHRHLASSSVIDNPRSTFSQPQYMELPPKDEALPLVYLYFFHLNQMLPLFSQSLYMQIFNELYLPERYSHLNSAAWCSIHVILALGNCAASRTPGASGNEQIKAQWHLQHALSLAPDILFHGTDILSVQALLGIAVILQGTSNPHACSNLLAASARLAYVVGLQQEVDKSLNLTPVEIEQRKRVFWLINILDKNISLRSEIPPLINLDDIDISFPNGEFFNSVGRLYLNRREGKVDMFDLRVRLSIISGLVYQKLYSAKARKQSDESRTAAVQSLDVMLSEWRESISIGLSLGDMVQRLDDFQTIHLVIVYSFYFHVLTMVHQRRESSKFKVEKSTTIVQRFDPLHFAPQVACVKAAEEFMFLINLIPQGNCGYIWLVLHSAVSAVITLLHHVLHSPRLYTCAALVECVGPMIEILPSIAKSCEDEEIRLDVYRMGTFCIELRRRALAAMNATGGDVSSNQLQNSIWS